MRGHSCTKALARKGPLWYNLFRILRGGGIVAIENGAWIMRGLDWDNPARIQSWKELIGWIDEIGFLPLFKNEVDGFSAEENTADLFWWTGDSEQDPWEWHCLIARSGKVAYGKFFGGKAGFTPRPGSLTSPTGGGTAMTLTAAGTRNWPPCARSGSWTALWGRMSGSPLR